jgi:hypothetical protein
MLWVAIASAAAAWLPFALKAVQATAPWRKLAAAYPTAVLAAAVVAIACATRRRTTQPAIDLDVYRA